MASIITNLPKISPYRPVLASSRPRGFTICRCCLPTEPNKARWGTVVKFYGDAVERAKGLRESLSPKVKGDWKDLLLVSFSFAVYIYISQQIVCTVLAWVSMQPNRF